MILHFLIYESYLIRVEFISEFLAQVSLDEKLIAQLFKNTFRWWYLGLAARNYFVGLLTWLRCLVRSTQKGIFLWNTLHVFCHIQAVSQNLTEIQFTNALDTGKVLWNELYYDFMHYFTPMTYIQMNKKKTWKSITYIEGSFLLLDMVTFN